MSRYHGTSATLATLIFAIASLAGASQPEGSAICEAKLARNPDDEEPALCFYQAAAGARLEKLRIEHPNNPWFSFYLANLKWRTHEPADVAEAQRLYALTAELAHRLGVRKAEYQARAGLSRIFRDSGRLAEEQAAVAEAVRIAKASGDRALQTKASILQADHWTARGELQKAYFILHQLRDAVDREGSYSTRRDYLFSFGAITYQTGRSREMHDAYAQLAKLVEANGDRASQAQAEYGLALARLQELEVVPTSEGRRDLLRLTKHALSVAQSAGNPGLEVEAHWMLGSFGDRTEAVGHLQRCFAVAATPRQRSYCRTALARRLATSDPAAALEAVDQAMALAERSGDVWSRTSLWATQMRVSWQIGPPERALADSEVALDAIEALRDQQGGSSSQPGLFSTWAEAYYWLSGRLLEVGELEAGFRAIERMRSRTLIDALGVSQPGPGVPPALLARRSDLALDIARVQRRLLDPSVGRKERIEARAELERLEVAEANLRAQIAHADPEFAALRPPSFVSLSQVRGALAPDEALLSFQIAPWQDLAGDFAGGSWLLVSSRGHTRLYRLPGRTELRPAVDTFAGMFGARDGSDAQAAPVVYDKLLGKALAELPAGVRRLVIVADDALHRLPFAALRPTADSAPLSARFEIALAPSATLWLRWRQDRPKAAGLTALVLADPVSALTAGDAASERAAVFAVATRLGPLPLAREEGRAVLRHLGRGKLLEGKNASETYLKGEGPGRYGLIHFATHAATDDVEPERSFVLLSAGSGKEDGLLQVREIVDLPLDGQIVVLSSCESGSGEILRGEGVMSLARAFFQAGAHTVVASLWPLRDDDGAALFDRFYHHLGRGTSVAGALQAAQSDRLQDGAPAEAWAGVVVLGDGARVLVPGGRRGPSMAVRVAAGLILLLAATGLLLRRRAASLASAAGQSSR